MRIHLPKDRGTLRIYKRCRRCRMTQKVPRGTRYCEACRNAGKIGLMESIF